MKKIDISNVAKLPTKYGEFKVKVFKEGCREHLVIFTDNLPKVPNN